VPVAEMMTGMGGVELLLLSFHCECRMSKTDFVLGRLRISGRQASGSASGTATDTGSAGEW
jgi:hypothetical protein